MKHSMLVVSTVLLILCCVSFVYLMNDLHKHTTETYQKAKVNLGKKVVINKDTLLITDYSMLSNTYMLSNGASINPDLVEKIEIK